MLHHTVPERRGDIGRHLTTVESNLLLSLAHHHRVALNRNDYIVGVVLLVDKVIEFLANRIRAEEDRVVVTRTNRAEVESGLSGCGNLVDHIGSYAIYIEQMREGLTRLHLLLNNIVQLLLNAEEQLGSHRLCHLNNLNSLAGSPASRLLSTLGLFLGLLGSLLSLLLGTLCGLARSLLGTTNLALAHTLSANNLGCNLSRLLGNRCCLLGKVAHLNRHGHNSLLGGLSYLLSLLLLATRATRHQNNANDKAGDNDDAILYPLHYPIRNLYLNLHF